ncbi:MAG: hypothetical protein U9R27_08540 [Campylobacterota bacterium]|nr:hypothetical protein [Campylobacterota bacterium]
MPDNQNIDLQKVNPNADQSTNEQGREAPTVDLNNLNGLNQDRVKEQGVELANYRCQRDRT